LKSPFDFVRLYGHYWGGHKTNLRALPIYTEAEEVEVFVENHAEAEAFVGETPTENHEVTPPPPQSHARYATRLYYGNATRF
ncbi:glycosyltransferase family 25 protein, partial [Helicobacter pylori]